MKIAIVEDDINMRKSLELALSDYPQYEIKCFKNAKDALKAIDSSFDLVVTDVTMPGMDGIAFVKELDGLCDAIVITGNATLSKAVEAMRLGVKDFLTKPFEIGVLVEAIERSKKVKSLKPKTQSLSVSFTCDETPSPQALSEAMTKVNTIVSKASITDATIMLLGESGVGKEVYAKKIHALSKRHTAPFIALNMAAIPDTLIESELFGYEKGAFTDAATTKIGKFEMAHTGTLFLDEIGEMPYGLQAKLLRAIQDKEITRLGGTKPIKIDVRILSATNVNIDEQIKNGGFREDLYYRLNTIPLTLPPLRERRDEIIPIALETLKRAVAEYGLSEKSFSQEALDELYEYQWPGNIRELISVCERATILSEESMITPHDLFLTPRGNTSLAFEEKNSQMVQTLLEQFSMEDVAKMLGVSKEGLEKKQNLAKRGE